jgi:hypothetical protein
MHIQSKPSPATGDVRYNRNERRARTHSTAALPASNDEFMVPSRRHDDPALFVGYRDELTDSVIALLAGNTKKQYSQRKALWNWLYRQNPSISDKELGLALVGQNRVVGYNGFIPIHLLRNGELIRSAWSFDTILSPEARGKGYGGTFVELVKSSYPIVLGFGIGDLQAKIMLSRGYRASSEIEQYFYVSIPRTIKEWVKYGLQLAKRLVRSHQRVGIPNLSIEIGSARQLPREIDRLWDSVRSSHQNIVVRNHAYMHWRYAMHPVKEYSTLVVREGDVLRALAIVEQSKERANLVDYVGGAGDREAMQLIVETFRAKSRDSRLLECVCTNAVLKSVLAINGFRCFRDKPRFFVYSNVDHDRNWTSNWFLMEGDSDSNYY